VAAGIRTSAPTTKQAGNSGLKAGVYVDDFRSFATDIRDADRDLYRDFRKELKAGGQIVAEEAKRRAAWSTRIPRTIKVSVTLKGVTVSAGGPKAPHAVVYEVGSSRNRGYIRHPVNAWARNDKAAYKWSGQGGTGTNGKQRSSPQKIRPYLGPALMAKNDELTAEVATVMDRFAARAGFR
jgi:hypothetical protein